MEPLTDADSARQRPTPVDRAAPFALEELFFSTTDRKAHITMSNDVFVRVSGYGREALIGAAHNVVRHPDTPRAAFALLWDYLTAGRPVAAYVKNMAADGAYYWVMATVVPVGDGFLSIRLKPTSELFESVKGIYAELRKLELGIEGEGGRNRKEAIVASSERLSELLAGAGFESYDAFMQAALVAEMAGREAVVGKGAARDLGALAQDADPAVMRVLDGAVAAHDFFDGLTDHLSMFDGLGEQLTAKSRFVLELADDIRLFSLNALVGSARLGEGATLGAVADIMRARSDAAAPAIGSLDEHIVGAADLLGELCFHAAAGKLQTEMMSMFVCELLEGDADWLEAKQELHLLADALGRAAERVGTALGALDRNLRGVVKHADQLRRELGVIRAIEVNGRIEAAHVTDAEQVKALFNTIGDQVSKAGSEMKDFDRVKGLVRQLDTGAVERAAACAEAARLAVESAFAENQAA